MSANASIEACFYTTLQESLKFLGYSSSIDSHCLALRGMSGITVLALLIIGSLAAAGCFPGAALPWVAIGLGAGSILLTLVYGDCHQRKFELISRALMAATFITLGALGGAGVLTTAEVAYGIIGTSLTLLPMATINHVFLSKRCRQHILPKICRE